MISNGVRLDPINTMRLYVFIQDVFEWSKLSVRWLQLYLVTGPMWYTQYASHLTYISVS